MGMYVSQDPIGLAGGILNLYGYVDDTNAWIDILGLGKSAYATLNGPLHHIATNKNYIRGKRWSRFFQPFFTNAGLNIDCPENKVYVPGHKGPHPDDYHQYVYDKLTMATEGIDPATNQSDYKVAVLSTLSDIATEAQTKGTDVNNWLTKV